MKQKKLPLRQCVACREMKSKSELIRIVKLPESNEFVLDHTGKLNGRGAYICNNEDCINLVIKKKLINRSYKTNISNEVYENLRGENFDK